MLLGDSNVEDDGIPPGNCHNQLTELSDKSTNEIQLPPQRLVSLLTKDACGFALQSTTFINDDCVEVPVHEPFDTVSVTE